MSTDVSSLTDAPGSLPGRTRLKLVSLMLLTIALVAVASYQGRMWYVTESWRKACDAARNAEDWKLLRQTAGKWAEWNPEDSLAWWAAAEAAQETDDFEDLALCLGKIPDSDPKVLFALVEKANVEWTVLNRPVEALATSLHALQIDPRVTELQSRVISYYAMTGQRVAMLKAIRDAIRSGAEPKESYTYLVMADVLSFANGGEINGRWLKGNPDEVRFKIGLAVHTAMKLAMDEDVSPTPETLQLNRDARKQLQWFLDANPGDPVLLTYLMHQAYRDGQIERMAELLKQVDQNTAEDHMVWVYRTWYHIQTGEFTEAEEAIGEALRIHPMSPLAHHEYANLLRIQQRPEIKDQQRLAAYGRELRSQMLLLPSAVDVTPALFVQIHSYAKECGDQLITTGLENRL